MAVEPHGPCPKVDLLVRKADNDSSPAVYCWGKELEDL